MGIELSGVQFGLKSYAWFQYWKKHCAQCKFDLKLNVWLQNKIAWYEVQLLLYYIHFACNLVCYNNKIWQLFSCAVLVVFFHWLGKRFDLEQKMVRFANKSNCWEPIRLYGSSVISFTVDVIKLNSTNH